MARSRAVLWYLLSEKMPTFTAEEKLRCVERELKMRRQVYPNRVLTKRMNASQATREVDLMEAIREDYRKMAEKERLL